MNRFRLRDSILNESQLHFHWSEGLVNPQLHRLLRAAKVQYTIILEYFACNSASSLRRGNILRLIKYQLGEEVRWFGQLVIDTVYQHDDPNPAKVAEVLYHSFYKAETERKLREAMVPGKGKQVIVYGHWVDEMEFLRSQPKTRTLSTIIYQTESGTEIPVKLFLLGSGPNGERGQLIFDVDKIGQQSFGSVHSQKITINGVMLTYDLDWCIYQPLKHMHGEYLCANQDHNRIMVITHDQWTRHVRGVGIMCGPCVDYLLECNVLSEDMLDPPMVV